jgi:multidrug efflux pump subunit AcrA (membrane-fusion protein)
MKLLWFITTLSMLLTCASCSRSGGAGSALAQNGPAPVTVSIAKAQIRDLADRIDLTGNLTADEQVTVYAKVPGYLKTIHFDIGDRVRKGQLIAELEVPEMTAGLAEKRAALVKAQASLEQARAAVQENRAEAEFAQINYQRLKNIHDRDADVLPGQDVDQARAGHGVASGKLKNAEAQVKVAEAAVTGAEAEIVTLNTMMAYSRIEAPMEGIITQRFVDPGALIQSASSSRTQAAPVVTIARVDRVRAIVDVPESSASYVRPGTSAALQVDGPPVPACGSHRRHTGPSESDTARGNRCAERKRPPTARYDRESVAGTEKAARLCNRANRCDPRTGFGTFSVYRSGWQGEATESEDGPRIAGLDSDHRWGEVGRRSGCGFRRPVE